MLSREPFQNLRGLGKASCDWVFCIGGIALLLAVYVGSVTEAQETSMVPVTVDGQNVRLAVLIYKPSIEGKVPTLVFNHGSTGTGRDPSLFPKSVDFPQLARFFVQRGWAVVLPSRRGRGGSEDE